VGGNGVLFFATGKKYITKIIKVSQSCLPTLPAYFPFETSFLVTLEPPRFTKGQSPQKIPEPAGQTNFKKMAEIRF
jgi:hypothetical protein